MSDVMLITLLIAGAALAASLAALLITLGRSRNGRGEELAGLRERLDLLLDAQRDVPRQIAEDSAIQARSLADLRERLVQVTEAARRLEAVGAAVGELHDLLKVPKLRGGMGEAWLEEVLHEVLPAASYEMEFTFRSGERVDAVVRLQDRLVPIDAKFPMEAFQRMRDSSGAEAERERRTFARSVRARIDEIADRYIRPDEGTFEFALMYIPAEGVYYEAAVRDQQEDGEGLAGYAHRRGVFLVSPNTLFAYLTALAHGLRGLAVERHAREILEALGGLRQHVARLDVVFTVVGRHLANAVKQHDEAARVLGEVQARLDGITEPANQPANPRGLHGGE